VEESGAVEDKRDAGGEPQLENTAPEEVARRGEENLQLSRETVEDLDSPDEAADRVRGRGYPWSCDPENRRWCPEG
jgi:hypothetical protein